MEGEGRKGKGLEGGRGQRWLRVGGLVGRAVLVSFRRVGPEGLARVVLGRQGP